MITLKKNCSVCGKEFPVREFTTKYRNVSTTYTTCRKCRYKNNEKYKKKELEPWFIKY